MPPLPSVVDLLAEQPEESLQAMREAVQRELARLTVEAQQIEQALAKKHKRSRGGTGGGRLTREQVYDAVRAQGFAMTPAEVHELLTAMGIEASLNSVRNHLSRLTEKDWLVKDDAGRFSASPVFIPAAAPAPDADDDIPF